MEHEKDYSLLRPFDLEAAKRGEKVIWRDGIECVASVLDGDGSLIIGWHKNGHVGMWSAEELRMAPLAWVEGKPVYKGDVLYYNRNVPNSLVGQKRTVVEFRNSTGNCEKPGFCFDNGGSCYLDELTWTPPKVKREGFVCIVKTDKIAIKDTCPDVIVRNCGIFATHETAQAWADQCGDVIAVAPITWEEPAA